jgi:nucleoside-diphosphate-sugar epimerase
VIITSAISPHSYIDNRQLTCGSTDGAYCLQVRIARIFNTYGPRMCLDDGRVVSNFVAQVIISH